MLTRTTAPAVAAVFVVALVLRLGHLAGLQTGFEGTHLFSLARGDAAHHWLEAQEILDRDFWLRDRIPWKGPGYSYFLAGLMQLFGRSPDALRWPLAFLGALNCAGLVLLARRILPLGFSVLAGLLAAINGVLILFDGELLFPTLLISLNLPVLLLLSRPDAGRTEYLAAGALLGLSSLVHPVYLLPTLALALLALRRSAAHALSLALAAGLVIAPLSLSNLLVRGQPVLISWNGGINLYTGNHPAFDQYSGNRTNAWARILQTPVDAGIEEEHARDRLYYRLAARQTLASPLGTLATLLQKTLILVSPVEYANNIRLYELRPYSPVLTSTLGRLGPLYLPFGLLGPLSLLGLALMLRPPRAPPALALIVWSAALGATIVLSFNTARYRAPLVFFGCIGAAYALHGLSRAWADGERKRCLLGAGLFLALVVTGAATAVPQRGFPLPLEWDEARALVSEGAFDRAEPWVARALESAPDDAPLWYAAAGFYSRQERREEERGHLQRMLALPDLEPDLISIGHHLLARSYALDRLIDEARREIELALVVNVDETTWRGVPYYQLGLGAATSCWLRLEAAEIEFRAGDARRAVAWMDEVETGCVKTGRIREQLLDLEARSVLSRPRLDPVPDPVDR